jgi:hypothetical protein
MRNLDFLWLVSLGWLVAILTVQTHGWQFIFSSNSPNLGSFFGSLISAVLSAIGGLRSIRAERHYAEILYRASFVLAFTLIALIIIANIVLAFVMINFTHFGS